MDDDLMPYRKFWIFFLPCLPLYRLFHLLFLGDVNDYSPSIADNPIPQKTFKNYVLSTVEGSTRWMHSCLALRNGGRSIN